MQRGRFVQLADAIDAVQRCAEPVRLLVQNTAVPRDAGPARETKSLVEEIRRNVATAREVLATYRVPAPRAAPAAVSAR
jgi:hypothetical protein